MARAFVPTAAAMARAFTPRDDDSAVRLASVGKAAETSGARDRGRSCKVIFAHPLHWLCVSINGESPMNYTAWGA
jgi:hypothetical protein